MAFRNGCYASLWGVYPSASGKVTSGRISISRKRKDTGAYETDFTGFVSFIGDANLKIQKYVGKEMGEDRKPIARIRLDEVAATVIEKPNQEGVPLKNREYNHQYQCFSFTDAEEQSTAPPQPKAVPKEFVDVPDGIDEELPFA